MVQYWQFLILSVVLFTGCSSGINKQPDVEWKFSKTEITGNRASTTDKLNVDVYLDATTSMKGFVSSTNTDYSRLLEDIEATCQNVWKNTDIKYFKFGRGVASISRNEFTSGKTSPALYSDPSFSTQTNFAEAVKNTNPERVSILITDFFYNNSDVNLVVNSIKEYCFQKGVEAGVIGLNSTFNGVVADVKPPISVNGSRPLYVLVFGDKQNINLLFNTLKNKPYINPGQFLLITNKPTEGYEVSVIKDRKYKSINKQSLKKEWQDYGTVFNFRMKDDEKEAFFNVELTLNTNPSVIPFSEKNLKTIAFKKASGAKDSVAADDQVVVQNVKLTGNKLKADVKITNNDKPGKYAYLVYLAFNNTVPPVMPAWVRESGTDMFAEGVNENKTLNLEKLLSDISTNHITYAQPKLAKFYINIEKQ